MKTHLNKETEKRLTQINQYGETSIRRIEKTIIILFNGTPIATFKTKDIKALL